MEAIGLQLLTASYSRDWLPSRMQPRRSVLQSLHEAEAAHQKFSSLAVSCDAPLSLETPLFNRLHLHSTFSQKIRKPLR